MINKQGISVEGWMNYVTSIPPKPILDQIQISALPYDFGEKISKSIINED